MPRMTRAQAAAVAEQLHIDENAALDFRSDNRVSIESEPSAQRAPLGEIALNSTVPVHEDGDDTSQTLRKNASNHAGKGGEKRSATNVQTPSARAAKSPVNSSDSVSDEGEITAVSASQKTARDLMRMNSSCEWLRISARTAPRGHMTLMQGRVAVVMSRLSVEHDMNAKSPVHAAVALTDNLLRHTSPSRCESTEPKSLASVEQASQCRDKSVAQPPDFTSVDNSLQAKDIVNNSETFSQDSIEDSADLPENKMPNTMQRSRSRSPVRLMTPKSQISSWSTSTGTNATYDELEAAAVEAQTPPRSIRDSPMSCTPEASLCLEDDADDMIVQSTVLPATPESQEKSRSKKSAPVVRATKASQARISLAHGPKDAVRTPSLGRPHQSSALNEAGRKRVTSSSSDQSVAGEVCMKQEVVIPHSKPRPMSMSFPAPLPPAKSTKAPTQSTFQLPGEAVAAKLKAAKDARLAREAEDNKKQPFKARPVPSYMTKAPAVRHTNSSMARESLINGRPRENSDGHSRDSSVANSGPRASLSRPITSRPSSAIPPPVKVSSRPNTAMANFSKVRVPESRDLSASIVRPPSAAQVSRATGTVKGKEVFNRPAQAKAAAEKEKREKEEATKKARAEAAERSRQLSREWAEKQRLRKLSQSEQQASISTNA